MIGKLGIGSSRSQWRLPAGSISCAIFERSSYCRSRVGIGRSKGQQTQFVELSARLVCHDSPTAHAHNAVSNIEEFLEIRRCDADCEAVVGQVAHDPVNRRLSTDIYAAREII